LKKFITKTEQNTFDLRQSLIANYKKNNADIVILTVDDATYEFIMDKYGSWPISRGIWAKVAKEIEKENQKYLIFDILFLKPNLNDSKADEELVKVVKENDNIFLSMNFDFYSDKIRKSPILDDKFKLKIKNGKLLDNDYITYSNARTVMPKLSNATKNIGSISILRDADGILRDITPIFKYKNNYYPNLSLAVALDYLNTNEISIENNEIILNNEHKIPLNKTQRATLNWYGKAQTFKHISLWETLVAIEENNENYIKENFENKIVYIGTSATSLSDIKSVPTESHLAGAELHATFLNNILDNSFIKKTDLKTDILVTILLSVFIGLCVLKMTSVFRTLIFLFSILISYYAVCTLIMYQFNIWIEMVFPTISCIATFVLIYCQKYILKTHDYEQTYKLAVTDGLTQLYNHRYFQEQMISVVNNYKRYKVPFSLILIDIDFFKKFNDTYGHQSGDCVLVQVAEILKKNSRTSDIVCRYGGEEMAIILTNTNKKEAQFTANKICSAVNSNKFTLANNEKVNVTISIGVATIDETKTEVQEIIAFADKCLYVAKENGRNTVVSEL